MTSIQFTNSVGYVSDITIIELGDIQLRLNASNTYYVNSLTSLIYIALNTTNLLILDLNYNYNRKLFELFTFSYQVSSPFTIKLNSTQSAIDYNINDGLTSVGYNKTLPITSLESVFMKLYGSSSSALTYLTSTNIVKSVGAFSTAPAELNMLSIEAANGLVLTNTTAELKLSIEQNVINKK